MKKLLPLALSLLLLLSACGDGETAEPYDLQATQALVDAGAFSVPLEELDAALLYDFEGYGIDASKLTGSKALSASGYTEQASVTLWKTADDAKAAVEAFGVYLQDMKDTYKSYAPLEVEKLDNAIVSQRGTSVLLVVPADADAAKEVLSRLE
jgi:hypothetical protein